MLEGLPKDPMMLLSVINTKLRDNYANLQTLCEEMHLSEKELTETLAGIDYTYDDDRNQFVQRGVYAKDQFV